MGLLHHSTHLSKPRITYYYLCKKAGCHPVHCLLLWSFAGNTILQCCALVDKQQQQQLNKQLPQQPQQDPVALAPPAAAPPTAAAGYEAVAGAAFGRLGRLLVSGVMYAELLGICCVYIVLEVS
jgi:hypothetical protein